MDMRKTLLLLPLLLLFFGCISLGEQMKNETGQADITPPQPNITNMTHDTEAGNQTNITEIKNETNQTQPPASPKTYERYTARGFSFEYPANMTVQSSNGSVSGIFTGTHELQGGQTGEIMIVTYLDTKATYGANKDEIFRDNPTKAASDLLLADKKNDPAGSLLSKAYEVGEISTFSIARDGYGAEVQFKIKFADSNKTYTGYAISIYVPERSLQIRMRVIALDSTKAKEIKDNFLLSFRLE